MSSPNLHLPACPGHRSGEYAPPWLAVRFAHICDECEDIVTNEILTVYGVKDLAEKYKGLRKARRDWRTLHEAWDQLVANGIDVQQMRSELTKRIVSSQKEVRRALDELVKDANADP